ncbi:hypothetical protein KIPE111705_13665 [Kibdelosporangium persicum]|uniref:hypothetical protein n=1 Tax=Kibdelosporangium persicum TaxID=2698649 RepID=UPI001566E9F3|nr:hypothetical protein [Kibdelosporangium persicum]
MTVPEQRTGMFRPLVWLVLIVSASGNVVASVANLDIIVGVVFGVITLTCGVTLVVHHYRNRRRT